MCAPHPRIEDKEGGREGEREGRRRREEGERGGRERRERREREEREKERRERGEREPTRPSIETDPERGESPRGNSDQGFPIPVRLLGMTRSDSA